VKKFIFFIVALQIISSGHFMDELVKFDNLVDHFYEHKTAVSPCLPWSSLNSIILTATTKNLIL
jgi:hypothetical protein